MLGGGVEGAFSMGRSTRLSVGIDVPDGACCKGGSCPEERGPVDWVVGGRGVAGEKAIPGSDPVSVRCAGADVNGDENVVNPDRLVIGGIAGGVSGGRGGLPSSR